MSVGLITVRVEGDEEAIIGFEGTQRDLDRIMRDVVDDTTDFIRDRARLYAGSKSGGLGRRIRSERPHKTAFGYEAEVGVQSGTRDQDAQSFAVHDGSGIYGPTGRPIFARPGNVLVFEIDGRTVFRRQVKGQRAKQYIERAFEDAKHRLG